MKIKFKKKDEHSKLPIKGSLHAAASDAYAHTITTREDGKIVVGLGSVSYTHLTLPTKRIV